MEQELTRYQFRSINNKQYVLGYIDNKFMIVGPVIFNNPTGVVCCDGINVNRYKLGCPDPNRVLPFENKKPK